MENTTSLKIVVTGACGDHGVPLVGAAHWRAGGLHGRAGEASSGREVLEGGARQLLVVGESEELREGRRIVVATAATSTAPTMGPPGSPAARTPGSRRRD